MKHIKRVQKEGSKKGVNKQTKTAPAGADKTSILQCLEFKSPEATEPPFDQSKWFLGIRRNLEKLKPMLLAIIRAPDRAEKDRLLLEFDSISKRLMVGFIQIGESVSQPGIPKITLEGRWLEEAGFTIGAAASVEVSSVGKIELTMAGGVR